MVYSDDIHSTQQFARAAEVFVDTLAETFPVKQFDAFFHTGTLQRAYWGALQRTLDQFDTPDRAPLVQGLLDGSVLSSQRVVDELIAFFVPGRSPNYRVVALEWESALRESAPHVDALAHEAEKLFMLLADRLYQSPELRLALQQLARVGAPEVRDWPDDATTAEKDLNRLLDAALIAGPSTLSLQVRHLIALTSERPPLPAERLDLVLCALTRLVAYLPADGLRTVWDNLHILPQPVQRLRALGRIAPYLSRLGLVDDPLAVVIESLDDAHRTGDVLAAEPDVAHDAAGPALRVELLLALAPHLETPNRGAMPDFQQRVLDEMRAVGDPASRVRALGALIPYLPAHLQSQAIATAFKAATEGIAAERARAEALSELTPHLPPAFQERLLGLAAELSMPEARALLLGRMIPHLDASMKTQALLGALNAIEQIASDAARARALIALAPHMDSLGPLQHLPEGLQKVIAIVFGIANEGDRARAFAALAPYLSPDLLREALQAVHDIADEYDRAQALSRLAQHLPPDLQVAAFGIARELKPDQARAMALVALAPYLALTARQQALAEALAAALAIERRYERVVALADLAPHLAEDLQARALSEALKATRSIPDEGERARALVFLAPHLLKDQLPDALADAYTILDWRERARVLSALVPRLPAEPRKRVGKDVLDAAREDRPPHHKASILAAIAPVLPDEQVREAVAVAQGVDTPYDRMHVLTALLPRDPEYLLDMALAVARDVPNRYQRANALLEVLPYTSAAQRYAILEEALGTALGVKDDLDRASALAHLAPYIDTQTDVQNQQQDALRLALRACFEVAQPEGRAMLLATVAETWARLLPPAQLYPLWREIVAFLRQRPQSEALSDLAALAPVLARMGAPKAIAAVMEKLLAALQVPEA